MPDKEVSEKSEQSERFTPGPWEAFDHAGSNMRSYSQSSGVVGTGDNREQIICGCFMDIGGEEVASANASLIAASPTMYAALTELVRVMRVNPQTDGLTLMNAVEEAEAALQKARGELHVTDK